MGRGWSRVQTDLMCSFSRMMATVSLTRCLSPSFPSIAGIDIFVCNVAKRRWLSRHRYGAKFLFFVQQCSARGGVGCQTQPQDFDSTDAC